MLRGRRVADAEPAGADAAEGARDLRGRRDLLERRRPSVTPQVMNVWFSGLYELAGQSIISNG